MFVSKARTYLSEAPFTQANAPALYSNIKLGCKGLPRTNTLAYLAHLQVTKKIKC